MGIKDTAKKIANVFKANPEKEALKAEKKAAKVTEEKVQDAKKLASKEIDRNVDAIVSKTPFTKEDLFNKGKLYKLINTGTKIALKGKTEGKKVGFKMLGQVLSNIGGIFTLGKLGLEIKKLIEDELDIKLASLVKNPDDINLVMQSEFVKNALSDPGLWDVIRLQSPRIQEILPKYKEQISNALASLIFEPSTLNDQSKIVLLETILKQPGTLGITLDILRGSSDAITKLITIPDSKLTKALDDIGIDANNLPVFLPHLIEILAAASEKQAEIAQVLDAIKPVMLGKKEFEPKDIVPVIPQLLSIFETMSPVLGKTLEERQLAIAALMQAKPVKDALAKLNIKPEVLAEFLPNIAEILSATTEKQAEIAQVLDAIKPVMLGKKEFEPKDIVPVIPQLLSIFETMSPVFGKTLEERQLAIAALMQAKPVKDALAKLNIKPEVLAEFLPNIAEILAAATEKQAEIAQVLDAIKPVMLGKKEFEPKDIVPVIPQLLSIFETMSPVLGNTLQERQLAIAALMQAKPVKDALAKLNIKPEVVAEFLPNIPEILAAATEKQAEIAQVLDAMKPVMLGKKEFEPKDIVPVIPQLLSIFETMSPVLGKTLEERQLAIAALMQAKPVKDALAKLNIKPETVEKLLPSISKDLVLQADSFLRDNAEAVKKIHEGIMNAEKGEFKRETDLTDKEVKSLLGGAIGIVVAANPEKLAKALTKEEAAVFVDLIPAKNLEAMNVSRDLVKKAAPIVLDLVPILFSKNALKSYRKDIEDSFDILVDDKSSTKAKSSAIFRVIDSLFKQLSSKEMQNLYTREVGIATFLRENKSEISTAIDSFIKAKPEIAKLGISGEKVVKVLSDGKTLAELGKIYNDVKERAFFGVAGKSIKLMTTNRDFRVVVLNVIISSIISFIRDSLYPAFFKRAICGSTVHKAVEDVLKKPIKQENGINIPHDLGEELSKAEGSSLAKYVMKYRVFSDLKLDNIEFNNLEVKDFDFSGARFGFEKTSSKFENCIFKRCNFKDATLQGIDISLKNSSFDLESFITLLPALEKAHAGGRKIDITGLKIEVPNITAIIGKEQIGKLQEGKFGKLVYEQCIHNTKKQEMGIGG